MHMSELSKDLKTSEILASVHHNIANGSGQYICIELGQLMHFTDSSKTYARAARLKSRIRFVMGNCADIGVEYWLIQKGYATREQTTDQAMKEYRIAWIKELIQEYQSKGD